MRGSTFEKMPLGMITFFRLSSSALSVRMWLSFTSSSLSVFVCLFCLCLSLSDMIEMVAEAPTCPSVSSLPLSDWRSFPCPLGKIVLRPKQRIALKLLVTVLSIPSFFLLEFQILFTFDLRVQLSVLVQFCGQACELLFTICQTPGEPVYVLSVSTLLCPSACLSSQNQTQLRNVWTFQFPDPSSTPGGEISRKYCDIYIAIEKQYR